MNHDSCSFMNINNMCIELGGFQKIFGGKNSKFQSLKGASLRLIRIGPVHIISVNFAATWFEQTQKLTTKNEVDNWSTISDQFQFFDEYFRWQMDPSWVDISVSGKNLKQTTIYELSYNLLMISLHQEFTNRLDDQTTYKPWEYENDFFFDHGAFSVSWLPNSWHLKTYFVKKVFLVPKYEMAVTADKIFGKLRVVITDRSIPIGDSCIHKLPAKHVFIKKIANEFYD